MKMEGLSSPLPSNATTAFTSPLQSISSLLQTPPFSHEKYQAEPPAASTLSFDTAILLTQSTSNRTIAKPDERSPTAMLVGSHLSQKHELLTVISNHDSNPRLLRTTPHLCYNDTVSFLHMGAKGQKALGVNAKNQQVGFYRTYRGQAEQWTILPSDAFRIDGSGNSEQDVDRCKQEWANVPLQSGQPILLQNELTGGLLSASSTPSMGFVLSTKSLQRVEGNQVKVHFENEEIWKLDTVHTPPSPHPSYAMRNYLTGTYLNHPTRHDIIPGQDLFQYRYTSRSFVGDGNAASRRGRKELLKLSVQEQDSVLVEEVLGALLGLDGQYIQYDPQQEKFTFPLGVENTGTAGGQRLDDNVTKLVFKLLPTASAFVQINAFVSTRLGEFEQGRVSHALCGAIDTLVKEYMEMITALDDAFRSESHGSGGLTLGALWGNLQQSCVRTISILEQVVQASKLCKGGALLNALERVRQNHLGDESARVLYRFLLERASVPYIEMLRGWLQDGTLKDPFAEFMVKESGRMKRQDFSYNIGDGSVDQWSTWYSLREEHVLDVMKSGDGTDFLTSDVNRSLVMKILTTGKYLNATKLCEHRDSRSAQLKRPQSDAKQTERICLSYGMGTAEMSRAIDREYEIASRTFLNIFMRDYRTLDVLAFMKRYFLLDQGDFFVQFLDLAETELLQEMSDVSRGRVQNWMALSIQMSGGADSEEERFSSSPSGPSKSLDIASSLTGAFATESLISHLDALHAGSGGIGDHAPKTPSRHVYGGAHKELTGVEAFMLDFHEVPFPLSLILSRHSIANYQLMFRHLFFAKHVERMLVGTWLDHQVIKEYQSLRNTLGKTYFLRQRMLHFMQNFVYYMMFEVIEPNWLEMEKYLLGREAIDDCETLWLDGTTGVSKQRTVDDVLKRHKEFVQKTLNECLLSNRDLIRTLTKLMTTCLLFSDQMKLFMETTQIAVEQNKIAAESRQKRNRKMFENLDSGSVKREKRMKDAIAAAKDKRRLQKEKQSEKLRRELETDSYKRMIVRFEQVFNSNLSEFMTQLMSDSNSHAHTHLSNLCVRLDYNGYVTRSMKKEHVF